tara:strand:- start:4534 stop:5043 length:510 start_codon:yes stop_codon:yes gene_type:complete
MTTKNDTDCFLDKKLLITGVIIFFLGVYSLGLYALGHVQNIKLAPEGLISRYKDILGLGGGALVVLGLLCITLFLKGKDTRYLITKIKLISGLYFLLSGLEKLAFYAKIDIYFFTRSPDDKPVFGPLHDEINEIYGILGTTIFLCGLGLILFYIKDIKAIRKLNAREKE